MVEVLIIHDIGVRGATGRVVGQRQRSKGIPMEGQLSSDKFRTLRLSGFKEVLLKRK